MKEYTYTIWMQVLSYALTHGIRIEEFIMNTRRTHEDKTWIDVLAYSQKLGLTFSSFMVGMIQFTRGMIYKAIDESVTKKKRQIKAGEYGIVAEPAIHPEFYWGNIYVHGGKYAQ